MRSAWRKTFEAYGLRWSRTRERGATAVVIALTLLLVMAAAAMSFDIANLALERQTLRNITDAAAQAGAGYLPSDPAAARAAAAKYAAMYDSSFTPTVTLWCVVGSTGATMQVAAGYIPSTCDPHGSGTYVNGVGGVVCDTVLCAIPCPDTGICNTVKVDGQKNVPYYFAPAIGINSGSTGAVTSVSCKGSCGTLMPNAMDLAVVADRTPSMSNTDFDSMKSGIASILPNMTPEYQLVTLGTIHMSKPSASCPTTLGSPVSPSGKPAFYPSGGARQGKWMPMGFSNDYLTGSLGSTGRTANTNSTLVKAVNCMDHHDTSQSGNYPWGTHLAAPLKAAARLLLGSDASNLGTLSAARQSLLPSGAKVTKAILFETDGYPEETMGLNSGPYKDPTTDKGTTDLGDSKSPTAPGDAATGCANLAAVATNAKNAGITIIMIAYGQAKTVKCGTQYVRDVMAAASSNAPNGSASKADKDCTTASGAADENSDGDYFFCAADASQLSSIFNSAVAQLGSQTRFVKMPGS